MEKKKKFCCQERMEFNLFKISLRLSYKSANVIICLIQFCLEKSIFLSDSLTNDDKCLEQTSFRL